MRYMGSKRRIADQILPIILKARKPGQWYVEPFCGGCNILKLVDGKRMAGDVHSELIAYLKALQNGWEPPDIITEEEYIRLKKDLSAPAHLRGYAGFTHSFGSIFFGTYSRYPDNRIAKSWDSSIPFNLKNTVGVKLKGNYRNIHYTGAIRKKEASDLRPLIKGVKFFNCSYFDLPVPKKSLLYCDPPYQNTSGYKTNFFPHDNFFEWCRRMSYDEGHTVFISEYNAPDDFKCVWQTEVTETLRSKGKANVKVEKLFTL